MVKNITMKDFHEPHLTTRKLDPENQETPIQFVREWMTPEKFIYLRNHFKYPVFTENFYRLQIDGAIDQPMVFNYRDLLTMPSQTLVTVIECSGNKRVYFRPRVYGEQWHDGAISQVVWKGVPLNYLLSLIRMRDSAKEIVFEGHDRGNRPDIPGVFPFARSVPLSKAMHPDTIIAYELNGKPIPYKHGFPLRLIVPGWYGMAWVKWLKRISVVEHPFSGPFQVVDYNYYPLRDSSLNKRPVTSVRINSIIQQPLNFSTLSRGQYHIQGLAWTGEGEIIAVEVSTDNGETWKDAKLQRDSTQPYSWIFWNYQWKVFKSGEYTIMSRAYDSYGHSQPFKAEWNQKGYGYNGVAIIKVKVG
jgi:DMSO/TMAO reductase YedYZ molybdopterin-dependent catalytic subunit